MDQSVEMFEGRRSLDKCIAFAWIPNSRFKVLGLPSTYRYSLCSALVTFHGVPAVDEGSIQLIHLFAQVRPIPTCTRLSNAAPLQCEEDIGGITTRCKSPSCPARQ